MTMKILALVFGLGALFFFATAARFMWVEHDPQAAGLTAAFAVVTAFGSVATSKSAKSER